MNDQDIIEVTYQSQHQFIYSEKNKERKAFVSRMILEYADVSNDKPINFYISEYGLPMVNSGINDYRTSELLIICKKYLDFAVAYSVLNKIISQKGNRLLKSK